MPCRSFFAVPWVFSAARQGWTTSNKGQRKHCRPDHHGSVRQCFDRLRHAQPERLIRYIPLRTAGLQYQICSCKAGRRLESELKDCITHVHAAATLRSSDVFNRTSIDTEVRVSGTAAYTGEESEAEESCNVCDRM